MQAEKEHNTLLDLCDRFREDMGEITDNISLATALETIWASRREDSTGERHLSRIIEHLILTPTLDTIPESLSMSHLHSRFIFRPSAVHAVTACFAIRA